MSRSLRSFVSIVLIIGLIPGVTGCFYDKESCDQVCAVAEELSEALINCDRNKMLELSTDENDAYNSREWMSALNYERSFDGDKLEVIEYIQSTMAFEVSRGTVDASSYDGTGEVDTYLTLVDYDSVCSNPDNMLNIDSLMSGLRNSDEVKRIRITMKFSYEDGEWKVSNLYDIFCSTYAFLNIDIALPNPVSSAVAGGIWFYPGGSTYDGDTADYVDATAIEMNLVLDPTIPNVDCSGVYYTVSYEGELLYTSDQGVLAGFYGEAQEPDYTQDGYLEPGSYTISFYDVDNELLYEDTVDVES